MTINKTALQDLAKRLNSNVGLLLLREQIEPGTLIKIMYEASAMLGECLTVIDDYEEVLAYQKQLVRDLDVALNGEEGAAKSPSLCDIVAQVSRESKNQNTKEQHV